MKRKHEMLFGAEYRADGWTRFRLWAPKANSVELSLAESDSLIQMAKRDEGWFEVVAEAPVGTQYQFKIDEQHNVPDPASRWQPSGIHGMSEVIDPAAFEWDDEAWNGRPWNEAVTYELHVGTFTPEGTYAAAERKLEYLSDMGITAIELMPLSSFPGQRNWGYDGVLPYAPTHNYGRPGDLKRFISSAHANNLMVFLDVVYNHFGPEGNYLWLYAPQFFTERHRTPWGPAINFDGEHSRTVRDYFIQNTLYWLEEYHFDGLRFDAVHAITDDSRPDVLTEIADRVRASAGKRQVHLVLENDDSATRYLEREESGRPRWYNAQWNDDIHHACHVLLTGERDGYYSDYADNPVERLGRCLTEGFAYQAEKSCFREGRARSERSRHLPAECFVSFLQNHDQIGNRALGERIACLSDPAALRTALAILLLAPSPPLMFMGEEFAATTPFLFFCDFGPDLANKVREGRRSEFEKFEQFQSLEASNQIPDPNDESTFLGSKLDWTCITREPHSQWLELYRELLAIRREKVVPLLKDIVTGRAQYQVAGPTALNARWELANNGSLVLLANLGDEPASVQAIPSGEWLYSTLNNGVAFAERIPPFSATWFLNA